jgi:hypothetical protein
VLRLAEIDALMDSVAWWLALSVIDALALLLAEVRIESEMDPDRLALLLLLTERLAEKDAL